MSKPDQAASLFFSPDAEGIEAGFFLLPYLEGRTLLERALGPELDRPLEELALELTSVSLGPKSAFVPFQLMRNLEFQDFERCLELLLLKFILRIRPHLSIVEDVFEPVGNLPLALARANEFPKALARASCRSRKGWSSRKRVRTLA